MSDGRRVGYKTYQNVLQLWEGSYLSRTKQSFYDWGVIAQHFEAMRLLGELQDTMKPLPSVDGQLNFLDMQAEEKTSAFSFSQEIIDAVLTRGSGVSEGKFRIYEQFEKSLSTKENADFLKNEYGWGGAYPVIVGAGIDEQHDGKGILISKGIGDDKPHIRLNWTQVEKRIKELIRLDRYLNPKEKRFIRSGLKSRRNAERNLPKNRETVKSSPLLRPSRNRRRRLKASRSRKRSMPIISAIRYISALTSMKSLPLMISVSFFTICSIRCFKRNWREQSLTAGCGKTR